MRHVPGHRRELQAWSWRSGATVEAEEEDSNTDWTNPDHEDRTHWRTKPSMTVDMETGAIVAVTLHGADVGDSTTISIGDRAGGPGQR